jgi:hypothetical protein
MKDQDERTRGIVTRMSDSFTTIKPTALFKSTSQSDVYNESINRDLNKRLILECRCDTRLKAKSEGSDLHVWHTLGGVGNCNT